MFQNASVNALMINVQVNEDYQMTGGEIVTEYNPDSPFVYDGRKDRTEAAETTTTTATTSTATTTAITPTEITIENEIDTVFINDDGKIVVLDTAGNATTHDIPKDENGESKEVTITDGAGNSYSVEGGEVKGGGELPIEEPLQNHDEDSASVNDTDLTNWERNPELAVIHETSEEFVVEKERFQLSFTIDPSLENFIKRISFYKFELDSANGLGEWLIFYDISTGTNVKFLDIDKNEGWRGQRSNGEYLPEGE